MLYIVPAVYYSFLRISYTDANKELYFKYSSENNSTFMCFIKKSKRENSYNLVLYVRCLSRSSGPAEEKVNKVCEELQRS